MMGLTKKSWCLSHPCGIGLVTKNSVTKQATHALGLGHLASGQQEALIQKPMMLALPS